MWGQGERKGDEGVKERGAGRGGDKAVKGGGGRERSKAGREGEKMHKKQRSGRD